MAAPQWNGPHAKAKSVGEVKALFRHNDKDRREEMNHANPHIDKSKTHENFTYRGLSYKEMCDVFDGLLASVDQGKPGSGKNARTLMQSVILYPPKGLTREQEKEWMMDAGRVLEARYGKNLIEIQFDMDEEHEYIDPETGEKVMSRNHGHARLFPEVGGKLNGKAFSSRAEIKALNHALDMMSVQKYGVHMMDGSKKKGGDPVEVMKVRSLRAEVEQLQEQADTLIADALDRAAEITTEARRDARATRKEADQDREQAKRERADAWIDAQAAKDAREDADEYARTTRRQADQDAQKTRAAAKAEADSIRQQAQAQARATQAEAEKRAQEVQTALRVKMQAELDEEREKMRTLREAHRNAQDAAKRDLMAWDTQQARQGLKSLLAASGAVVEVYKLPAVKAREINQGIESAMERMRGTMARNDANRATSGPTTVEWPTY